MMPPKDLLDDFFASKFSLTETDNDAVEGEDNEKESHQTDEEIDSPIISRIAVPIVPTKILSKPRLNATLLALKRLYNF
jgi:hypothetical protein